jgi:hypothetical protein
LLSLLILFTFSFTVAATASLFHVSERKLNAVLKVSHADIPLNAIRVMKRQLRAEGEELLPEEEVFPDNVDASGTSFAAIARTFRLYCDLHDIDWPERAAIVWRYDHCKGWNGRIALVAELKDMNDPNWADVLGGMRCLTVALLKAKKENDSAVAVLAQPYLDEIKRLNDFTHEDIEKMPPLPGGFHFIPDYGAMSKGCGMSSHTCVYCILSKSQWPLVTAVTELIPLARETTGKPTKCVKAGRFRCSQPKGKAAKGGCDGSHGLLRPGLFSLAVNLGGSPAIDEHHGQHANFRGLARLVTTHLPRPIVLQWIALIDTELHITVAIDDSEGSNGELKRLSSFANEQRILASDCLTRVNLKIEEGKLRSQNIYGKVIDTLRLIEVIRARLYAIGRFMSSTNDFRGAVSNRYNVDKPDSVPDTIDSFEQAVIKLHACYASAPAFTVFTYLHLYLHARPMIERFGNMRCVSTFFIEASHMSTNQVTRNFKGDDSKRAMQEQAVRVAAHMGKAPGAVFPKTGKGATGAEFAPRTFNTLARSM